jgi:hypothetical protein
MISEMQDFMMQFPTYGRQQSARWMRVYEDLKVSLFGYLFHVNRDHLLRDGELI